MPETHEKSIGALWERKSKSGKEYLSGEVNGERIVVFRATSSNPKAPQWRIFVDTPREKTMPQEALKDDDIAF